MQQEQVAVPAAVAAAAAIAPPTVASPVPTMAGAAGAASSASLGKGGWIRLEGDFRHSPTATVAELFASATQVLGRSDFTQPLRLLAEHLVETVADLRLLVVENQLREVGLPIRLCVWIEEEIARLQGAAGGVSVVIPTVPTAALPPIPLSAPIAPRPVHTTGGSAGALGSSGLAAASAAVAVSPVPLSSPEKVAIFQYHFDFDSCGVISYLATGGGTRAWTNPMDAGHVTVTASGVNKDSAPLSAIVGRDTVRCVTNSSDASYVQIELGDFYCRPTNYTLKHYLSYDTECLRDWKLEGSVSGQEWVLLKEHRGDTNLNTKGGTCTWSIQPDDPKNFDATPSSASNSGNSALAPHLLTPSLALSSHKHWYRYFRITMLGPNSNQHLYLACSGFELYGYVLSKTQMQAWQSGNGSVSSIPTFMSANYPPWPLPKDAVLNIQQGLHGVDRPTAVTKGLHVSPSSEDLNSTLDDLDEDDYKVPSSLGVLSGQLANLSFVDPADNKAVAAVTPVNGLASLGSQGLFTYSSDFDKNGIIWALATRQNGAAWVNPVEAGLINITASSVMDDSTPLSAIAGRDTVRCVTKPLAGSWVLLDFLSDKRLLLTHYTLKHYSSWDTECVRCWRVEASLTGDVNNPHAWTVLREHIMDENLNGKGGTFTWSISGGDIQNAAKQQQPFRYLRIIQTAENSNKHHYLAISGLELYGRLLQGDGATPYNFGGSAKSGAVVPQGISGGVSSGLRQFTYQSNFDQNGILHWLATCNYTRPWTNPADAGFVRLAASSLNDDSEPISAIVGRAVVRCVTQPIPEQWFAIDFGASKLIQPTAYSLRHYSSWDTEALRNWRFEGSTDSDPATATWVRLTEHKEDFGLDGKGSTCTWPVQTTRFFRMFRIYQFDKNSNKHHYLALSGFELYGTVKSDGSAEAMAMAPVMVPGHPPAPLAAAPFVLPPIMPPAAALQAHALDMWDGDAKGAHLVVNPATPYLVRNNGSQDKWQICRGRIAYSVGVQMVSVKLAEDPHTTNTWRFILGVVPSSLDCKGAKQWVGTSNSWGFISGTGGKCHNTAVTVAYGTKYTQGDIVTIHMNFDNGCLGFFRNDEYQGTAFTDLAGPVHLAASLTATESALLIVPTPPNVAAQIAAMSYGGAVPAPMGAAGAAHPAVSAWDPSNKSASLVMETVGGRSIVRNINSSDKWQSCRSVHSFSGATGARHRFEVELVDCPKTNNSWQAIVGVVPASFTCSGNKQWVGAGESWGYIGGTGGKCFNQPKTLDYGEKYGRAGDVIACVLDFAACTIEFFKNGVSQGVAFTNLTGTVYAAVSLTATGATARLNIL